MKHPELAQVLGGLLFAAVLFGGAGVAGRMECYPYDPSDPPTGTETAAEAAEPGEGIGRYEVEKTIRFYAGDHPAHCAECGKAIEQDEVALMRDGEVLCSRCLRDFAADDIGGFVEWVTADANAVTHGYNFREEATEE